MDIITGVRTLRRSTGGVTKPAGRMKVVMLSHMDPRLSRGGAEIAAMQLFEQLSCNSELETWFISAAPGKIGRRDGVVFGQPFDDRSYVYAGGAYDHFIHANMDADFFEHSRQLFREIDPDIVHFHHYANFGVEIFSIVKQICPRAKIVLTLHEFLAICNHYGQMVKKESFALCKASSDLDCSACFPDRTPQDFFLRRSYIQRYFRDVDQFVAPSEFLARRYVDWGIEPGKMSVIENGSLKVEPRSESRLNSKATALRVGFFGQISKLKGINVVIEAARLLSEAKVRIELHGDYSAQPPEFQADFLSRIKTLPDNIQYVGPYENEDVAFLMRQVDAVLVPSIWWENSPLVIQEAMACGCPVICSDIGGMKEKVQPGRDGFHFRAGSADALAELLEKLAADRNLLDSLRSTITAPPTIEETAERMLASYAALLHKESGVKRQYTGRAGAASPHRQ